MTQVLDTVFKEEAYFRFSDTLALKSSLGTLRACGPDALRQNSRNDYTVRVYEPILAFQRWQYTIHCKLEHARCVFHVRQNSQKSLLSMMRCKRHFVIDPVDDLDLPVSRIDF